MPQPICPLDEDESAAARRVAERLRVELEELVLSLPVHLRGAAAMSRVLEIDRSTCQRVAKAVRSSGAPLEVLIKAPGVEGLRRFAKALAARRTEAVLLKRAEEAFAAFATLIENLAGSQAALARRVQAIPSGRTDVPTIGAENALREQAFEAMSYLTGRQLEVQSNTILMRPVPSCSSPSTPRGGIAWGATGTRRR